MPLASIPKVFIYIVSYEQLARMITPTKVNSNIVTLNEITEFDLLLATKKLKINLLLDQIKFPATWLKIVLYR